MTEPAPNSCLQIFFADVRAYGEWPLLSHRLEKEFRHVTKREAATQVCRVACALSTLGILPQTRVTLQGVVTPELWIAEWGILANRSVAAIVPQDFSAQELVDTLFENNSKLVFVANLATAHAVAEEASRLPHLMHIVCFEGNAGASILSWEQFLDQGKAGADTTIEKVRSILPKDMAVVFYHRDEAGSRQATIYSHALLLEKARKIDAILGYQIAAESTAITVQYKHEGNWRKATSYAKDVKSNHHYIRTVDTVMAAVDFAHAIGHIAAYYVPVLKEAAVQIADVNAAVKLSLYRPHVIIGEGVFFDAMRKYVTEQIQLSGTWSTVMLRDVLQLGKLKYESAVPPPLKRLQYLLLKRLLEKKVLNLLGGRLRLLIGADDAASYETKVFFYTFGIDLLELPLALLAPAV